jgi:hypothetical protein
MANGTKFTEFAAIQIFVQQSAGSRVASGLVRFGLPLEKREKRDLGLALQRRLELTIDRIRTGYFDLMTTIAAGPGDSEMTS